MLIDSHVNLHAPQFDEDRDAVIARAREAGVALMVEISDKLTTFEATHGIAMANDDIWCTVGVHPHEAKDAAELTAAVKNRVSHRGAALRQLTEGAEHLFHNLHRLGFKTAILSGGFTYFGRYLQQKLNIDYVYANELEIVDGKMTGNVIGQVVDGKRKAALLEEIAATENIRLEQTVAVGDGANDLPMLGKAGLGIAFRAKPIVRETARQSISTLGLDAILYLMGFRDRDALMV